MSHARTLLTHEVYAEKTLKEKTKEIFDFISTVAPCAQLSFRYISGHLDTFPLHGIGSKIDNYVYSVSCPDNDAYQRHSMFPSTWITHTHPRMVTPEPLTDLFRRTHSFRGLRRLREEDLKLPYVSYIWLYWLRVSSWFDRPFGINTLVGGTVLHSSRKYSSHCGNAHLYRVTTGSTKLQRGFHWDGLFSAE